MAKDFKYKLTVTVSNKLVKRLKKDKVNFSAMMDYAMQEYVDLKNNIFGGLKHE